MKEYSQPQKIISVLMIFTLLIELAGCVEYRAIPNTDLPDYRKYNQVIYCEKSKYVLDSAIISNEILSGVIDLKQSDTRKAIHVYPLSDSVIKIDTANFLTLLIDDIEKVKVPKNYIPKEYRYTNSSKKNRGEKEPAGKTILYSLYYLAGLIVTSSLAWWIFEKKRH
jgi:hypothetical protein